MKWSAASLRNMQLPKQDAHSQKKKKKKKGSRKLLCTGCILSLVWEYSADGLFDPHHQRRPTFPRRTASFKAAIANIPARQRDVALIFPVAFAVLSFTHSKCL